MSRARLERRLADNADRQRALREELRVADEQLEHLASEADDARLRSLVSETPIAGREHREAQRHADAMQRHRAELATAIADLEQAQDELLDQLVAEQAAAVGHGDR
jgi:hypothetical protein